MNVLNVLHSRMYIQQVQLWRTYYTPSGAGNVQMSQVPPLPFCMWYVGGGQHRGDSDPETIQLSESDIVDFHYLKHLFSMKSLWHRIRESQTVAPREKCRVSFLWASSYNTFVNQSIHHLILYVFLHTYCWFTKIELTTNRTSIHVLMKLSQHMHFLHEVHHSLLALGNMRQ